MLNAVDRLQALVKLSQKLDWTKIKKSIIVDLISFSTTNRDAIRIPKLEDNVMLLLNNWAIECGSTIAEDSFFCIISKSKAASFILSIDSSATPHTFELGKLLGYPTCCSKWMGDIGEETIDEIDHSVISSRNYINKWKVINHAGYLSGLAWISHVPCSDRCINSYNIAMKSITGLQEVKDEAWFSNFNHPHQEWLKSNMTLT